MPRRLIPTIRRQLRWALCLQVIGLLAWTSAASAKPKAAVLGIETRGQQDPQLVLVGKLMTQKLRTEVAKPRSPYELSKDGKEDFLTVKIMHDCPGGAYPCMSRITKEVLKAKYAIYGTVEKDSRGYVFQLTLLNAETAQPEGQLTEVVPLGEGPDDEKASRWARAFYAKLLGERQEGKLVVRSNVAAGTVFVDGKDVGDLADGVVVVPSVGAGEHVVSIEADGQTTRATVKVIAGETSEVTLTLPTIEGPGPVNGGGSSNTGWKIAFYGGLAVSAGLWTYTAFEANRLGLFCGDKCGKYHDDVTAAFNDAQMDETNPSRMQAAAALEGDNICDDTRNSQAELEAAGVDDECDRGKRALTISTVTFVGAVITTLASGVLAYKAFTGGGPSRERNDLSSKRRRTEPRVKVLPGGPGDIGAGLEITF